MFLHFKITCPLCGAEFVWEEADSRVLPNSSGSAASDSSGSASEYTPSGSLQGQGSIVKRNVVCPSCHGLFGIDTDDI